MAKATVHHPFGLVNTPPRELPLSLPGSRLRLSPGDGHSDNLELIDAAEVGGVARVERAPCHYRGRLLP